MKSPIAAAMVLTAAATRLHAQVGYPPAESPYRDLDYRQEFSLSLGFAGGPNDPIQAAPGDGAIVAGRYEIRLTRPLIFSARVARAFTERTVVEFPDEGPRITETRSWPMYMIDVGFGVSLTGAKSWHGIVPVAGFGAGVAGDWGKDEDAAGFKVGTSFAFSLDGGVRWRAKGPFQVRATLASHWYQVKYPAAYFTPPDEGPALRSPDLSTEAWNRSLSLTVGVAYLILR